MAAKSEAELDSLLSTQSYLCGPVPTLTDALVAQSLGEPPPSLPHLRRWAAHLASFTGAERSAWPVGDRLSLAMPEKKPKGAKPKAPPQAAKETPAKESPAKAEAETAEDLPERLLREIDAAGESGVDSRSVARSWGVEHQRVVGALKSLEATEGLVATEQGSEKRFELSAEGKLFVAEGSHEFRLLAALPADGLPQAELMKSSPHAKIGFSKAMAAGWVAVDKGAAGGPRVLRKAPEGTVDSVADALRSLAAGTGSVPDKDLADLKKRKLLSETTTKFFTVRKGPNFTTKLEKPETDLTPEMIASGSWKDKTFKAYNFEARGAEPKGGHLHPLLKVRSEFRSIFLEMGFTEMATNNYVESSFWNFDALFQPQQHPARDAHDTFFLSRPATSTDFPRDYLERVRKVHSEGDFGSQGYGCSWSEAEAGKNLLRTHTTAVSARMLYALAHQKGGFVPTKLFSIDRVFRNETLDATHLAEFHQVEGVVAERGLSLAHLIGVLHAFFQKLGIPKLRFKPAYNPYTEPSMEIFSYHEGLKKWVEIGNSGIFRPEMLLPMGLPEDVSVIAWGLSLERPTMIRYGYDNIRDLFGPKVNLKMVQDNPLCRLDK